MQFLWSISCFLATQETRPLHITFTIHSWDAPLPPPAPPLFKGAEINFDYPPPHPPGREGIWKIKNRGWKYGAGAGLLKRRGWHFSNLNFSRFIIFTFRNYLSLDKIVFLSREKFFIFVCHHGFMKKGYSKLSKNEPENIL